MKRFFTYKPIIFLNHLVMMVLFASMLNASFVPDKYAKDVMIEIEANASNEGNVEESEFKKEVDEVILLSISEYIMTTRRNSGLNHLLDVSQDLHLDISTPPPES